MPIVRLEAGARNAIKTFLDEKGLAQPVRIDLISTGCCDPSLGLSMDMVRDFDLVQEEDGLTFVISQEIHRLVGDVTISCATDKGQSGFTLTSAKPLSEWDGFGICTIRA